MENYQHKKEKIRDEAINEKFEIFRMPPKAGKEKKKGKIGKKGKKGKKGPKPDVNSEVEIDQTVDKSGEDYHENYENIKSGENYHDNY